MVARQRRSWLALGLLVLLIAASGPLQVAGQDPADDGFLIRLKRDVQPKQIRDDAPDHFDLLAGAIKDKLSNLGVDILKAVGSAGYMLAKLSDGIFPDGTVKAAIEALGFEAIANTRMNISAIPDDALWSSIAPAMEAISAETAWNTLTGDATTKVCVIDSGIRFDHPDLAGNMPDQLVYNAITNELATPNNDDTGGHGTHVAGTIAAVGNNAEGVAGVSWKAHVIGCKFIDGETGPISDAIECIRWCRDQGARIMSNSWGSSGDNSPAPLAREIQLAQDAGVLFVIAAGNENANVDVTPSSPGDVQTPNMIVVGALDNDGSRASFSNYGSRTVDLFAPGVDITSTWPVGPDGSPYGYNTISGTSMACPHVSGAAALLWSFKPSADYAEIKAALLSSVDTNVPGAAQSKTGGRLNVARALEVLTGGGAGGTPPGPSPPDSTPGAPDTPPDSPPSPDGGSCEDLSSSCLSWAVAGYCAPGWTYQGEAISQLCPASCDTCGSCTDLYTECPDWQAQGFCDPGYLVDGVSVADVACRASCGTCGSALVAPQTVALDISGVWSTGGGLLDKLLPLFIKFDRASGRGYGVWLKSPPMAVRIESVGSAKFLLTDVAGDTYAMTAEDENISDGKSMATKLTVGKGDKAVTWTRDTTLDKGLPWKYVVSPGETLDAIAAKFNCTLDALKGANPFLGMMDGALPLDGLPLVLPGGDLFTNGPAALFDFLLDALTGAGGGGGGSATSVPPPAPSAPLPTRRLLRGSAQA